MGLQENNIKYTLHVINCVLQNNQFYNGLQKFRLKSVKV